MARYRATDPADRRTEPLRSWVTPADKKRVEAAAARAGMPVSDYVRHLCLRRQDAGSVVAGTRRNAAAKALADQIRAVGNNLNQLARVANQTGEVRREGELLMAIDMIRAALAKVITL